MHAPDTNVWIEFLKRPGSIVGQQLRSLPVEKIWVCSVVRAELLHGAMKYARPD